MGKSCLLGWGGSSCEIVLIACDSNGGKKPRGYILSLSSDGRFHREESCNGYLGLDLNDVGQIKIDKEFALVATEVIPFGGSKDSVRLSLENGKTVSMWLTKDDEGQLYIIGQSESNDAELPNVLLGLTKSGRLVRFKNIDKSLGFKLTKTGKIKQDKGW